jgi:protein SCO1
MQQGGTQLKAQRRRRLLLSSAIALALCGAAATLLGSGCKGDSRAQRPLEIYGTVPAFAFTTQQNKSFTHEDLLGRVSIANFIFTRCPTVCPVFSMKMQRVAEQTDASIQLISFSVDPEYDTPERLAAYARDFQADPTRWHFLTGEATEVRQTVEGALKIAMADEGLDENGLPDIVHGTHFVLLDSEGRIRGYYNSDDVDRIEEMIRDARQLVKQSSKAS